MPNDNLGALMIELEACQSLKIKQHMGRAVQRECLRIIGAKDAELADHLHRDTHLPKPYVASGLLDDEMNNIRGKVRVGKRAWLRLCGLNAAVMRALDTYTQFLPAHVDIDHTYWRVKGATWNEHPWSGRTTHGDLLERHRSGGQPGFIRLDFVVPTCFHSDGLNFPLPLPTMVFNSLLDRWNQTTELLLPIDLAAFIEHFIELEHANVTTQTVMLKQPFVGFTGAATFTIVRHNEKLLKNDPKLYQRLKDRHAELSRALGLLAEFAFYSGIGAKTTTGMGMARPLSGKSTQRTD